MKTSTEQAGLQDLKTRINVVTFNFFVGEIPKEEASKIHWSPIQGALLVAGIQMTGFIPPQELEDNLRFTNCETWRINHFRYVWNKWCSTYDPTCAVTPSDFLEWYEKNPAPPLDYSGRPIRAQAVVTVPAATPRSLESVPAGDMQKTLSTTRDCPSKKRRSTPLREMISHARQEANSSEPSIIFSKIYEWAEKKQYSLVFTNVSDGYMPTIESTKDSGRNITITLSKVRKTLKAMG